MAAWRSSSSLSPCSRSCTWIRIGVSAGSALGFWRLYCHGHVMAKLLTHARISSGWSFIANPFPVPQTHTLTTTPTWSCILQSASFSCAGIWNTYIHKKDTQRQFGARELRTNLSLLANGFLLILSFFLRNTVGGCVNGWVCRKLLEDEMVFVTYMQWYRRQLSLNGWMVRTDLCLEMSFIYSLFLPFPWFHFVRFHRMLK